MNFSYYHSQEGKQINLARVESILIAHNNTITEFLNDPDGPKADLMGNWDAQEVLIWLGY